MIAAVCLSVCSAPNSCVESRQASSAVADGPRDAVHTSQSAVLETKADGQCDSLATVALSCVDTCDSRRFAGRMPFLPPNQQRQSTEGLC